MMGKVESKRQMDRDKTTEWSYRGIRKELSHLTTSGSGEVEQFIRSLTVETDRER